VRANVAPEPGQARPGQARILDWDAAGVARAVGPEVTLFKPGDRVWYAGSIARQGCHAELQRVDKHIVGPMPASLGYAEAAALPLTSLDRLGLPGPDYIVSLSHTDQHFTGIAESIAPRGKFGLIDLRLLKRKSASVHREFMFTRGLFGAADMAAQHAILSQVAQLVDARTIRTMLNQHFGGIDAANLKRAHALIESHQARGKIVLEGW